MASFLEIVSDLRKADTKKSKFAITERLSDSINDDDRYVDFFLNDLIRNVVLSLPGDFYSITQGEFYSMSVHSYMDEDFHTRVAISMSYLQDFQNHIDGLDDIVIKAIYESLLNNNLDLLVNDISVNDSHMRNGIKVIS